MAHGGTLYKVLDRAGQPIHGGGGQWMLPQNGKPSPWMPKINNIEVCANGYHLCREGDVIYWLGSAIYEAEGRGEYIRGATKTVWQEARLIRRLETWTKRTQRLFACDCADRVLSIVEGQSYGDARPGICIRTARDYIEGKVSKEELASARNAAMAMAHPGGTSAGRAADYNASHAAEGAASWAANTIVRCVARSAFIDDTIALRIERKWQTQRLFQYLRGELK